MSDEKKGLYRKYRVERVDGSKRHEHCAYFVLDLTHDKYADAALEAYANACAAECPVLAQELMEGIDRRREHERMVVDAIDGGRR